MSTRQELKAQGERIRAELGLPEDVHAEAVPGFSGMMDELCLGAIWGRPGLGMRERMIAVLCVLSARERHGVLRAYVGAGLRIGLEARTIQEVFVHAGLYAGFVTSESALAIANEVFEAKGVTPAPLPEDTADVDISQAGHDLMHALHGERSAEGYADPNHPTTGALYHLAIVYGYGALWNRPGLTRRERFICAVATFATIDHHGQLAKFVESGLAELSRDEIVEVLMQTAPYSGFPRALNALTVAADVFAK